MKMQLEQDKYYRIQLLSYDQPNESTERFYFLEMATLQATTLLQPDLKIIHKEIIAYNDANVFFDETVASTIKTIGDFNEFFLTNTGYYIHNCELETQTGLKINSHDDGEVSIQFSDDRIGGDFINKIWEKFQLDKALIEILKSNRGCFIFIDENSKIIAEFISFDDYIENGRS
jgi:hypothetical protein